MLKKLTLNIALLVCPLLVQADVLSIGASGFVISNTVETLASPADSWKAMIQHIDQWWHPDHTWSGDAGNLHINAEIGGCFCENLPQEGAQGGVEHLRIIYLNPPQEIRFDGALGPLQAMAVQGRMLWKIEDTEAGSSITFTYRVHGFIEDGFAGIAPAVDGVIKQQLERLAQNLNPH